MGFCKTGNPKSTLPSAPPLRKMPSAIAPTPKSKYIEGPNPFTNCPLVFVVIIIIIIVIMIMIQDAPVIGCMTILSGRAGPGNVPQPDEEIAKALIVKAKLLKECDESGEGLEEGERDRQGPKNWPDLCE